MVTYAQNQFIYVRYNPKDGNVSAIIRTIDNLIQKSTGETIVFLSQASTPIVATSYSEWEEIRVVLLSMQTAFEYYPEDEALKLNKLKDITPCDDLIGIWAQLEVDDIYPFTKIERSQMKEKKGIFVGK